MIGRVLPETPASLAGLKPGDVIDANNVDVVTIADKAALDEGIAILGQAAESFEAASKAAE